jgi:hypothetical protein
MNDSRDIIIEGKIVSSRDGEKRMNKGFTYGYRSLRVKSGNDFYSVLVNSQKFNDYGFLPKEGQWVRIKGKLYPSDEYEPSIKSVKELTHIEEPIVERILAQLHGYKK